MARDSGEVGVRPAYRGTFRCGYLQVSIVGERDAAKPQEKREWSRAIIFPCGAVEVCNGDTPARVQAGVVLAPFVAGGWMSD